MDDSRDRDRERYSTCGAGSCVISTCTAAVPNQTTCMARTWACLRMRESSSCQCARLIPTRFGRGPDLICGGSRTDERLAL